MTFSSVPLLMAGAFGLIVMKRSQKNTLCITFPTSVLFQFRFKRTFSCTVAGAVEGIFVYSVYVFDEHARRTRLRTNRPTSWIWRMASTWMCVFICWNGLLWAFHAFFVLTKIIFKRRENSQKRWDSIYALNYHSYIKKCDFFFFVLLRSLKVYSCFLSLG